LDDDNEDIIPINPDSGIVLKDFLAAMPPQQAQGVDPNILRFASIFADQLGTLLTVTPQMYAETLAGILELSAEPDPRLGPEFEEMARIIQGLPENAPLLPVVFNLAKLAYGEDFGKEAAGQYNQVVAEMGKGVAGEFRDESEESEEPAAAAPPTQPAATPGGELDIQH
jgi:hypothetical protein